MITRLVFLKATLGVLLAPFLVKFFPKKPEPLEFEWPIAPGMIGENEGTPLFR